MTKEYLNNHARGLSVMDGMGCLSLYTPDPGLLLGLSYDDLSTSFPISRRTRSSTRPTRRHVDGERRAT